MLARGIWVSEMQETPPKLELGVAADQNDKSWQKAVPQRNQELRREDAEAE